MVITARRWSALGQRSPSDNVSLQPIRTMHNGSATFPSPIVIGVTEQAQGNIDAARESLEAAHSILKRLTGSDPNNAGWQRDLAVSHWYLLNLHQDPLENARQVVEILSRLERAGRLAPGDNSLLAASRDIVNKLEEMVAARRREAATMHPAGSVANAGGHLASGLSHIEIGDAQRAEGKTGVALENYRAARTVFQSLTRNDPGNNEARFYLGLSWLRIGDLLRTEGDNAEALNSSQAARAVFQSLVEINRNDFRCQDHLAIAQGYIGVLMARRGDFDTAVECFKTSVLIRDNLIAANPDNAEQRYDLSNAYRNMGIMQQAQSRFDVALASFDAALSIRMRLAADDPGNGKWRRELIAMHNDVGDLHHARHSAAAAVDSYKAGLAVARHLAETDPANTEWQRDVKVLLKKIGDVRATQGNPARNDPLAERSAYKADPATSTPLRRDATVADGVDGLDWVRVPDAVRQPELPVSPPPDWVDGFRFARTMDGLSHDGSPRISPERGYVTGKAERDRLLAYLTGGAMVVDRWSREPDLIDPTRQMAVPACFRTDGTWVWPGSVEYYLRWHNVAPEPELRARIEQRKYRCPSVETAIVTRTRVAIDRRADLIHKNVDAFMAEHPELRPGDPDRFEAEVNERLLAIGWTRGRDISSELFEWLAPRVAELSEKFGEQNGSPSYAPFPAAVAVMREFGGLVSLENGRGQTMAQLPFVIYPAPYDDLIGFAPDVRELAKAIGSRAFQVGEVEQGMGALVVDESGRIFLVGPVQLYAGANIDEALTRMLRGIRCEELSEVGLG